MSTVSILVLSVTWATSSAYVMYYHNKHYTLGFDMVIGAIILGPVLMFLVGRDVDEKKKYYGVMEDNNRRMDETHRRWFDLHNRINRERTPNWFRTIPPPPPISRVEPPNRRPNKTKDFKFFH